MSPPTPLVRHSCGYVGEPPPIAGEIAGDPVATCPSPTCRSTCGVDAFVSILLGAPVSIHPDGAGAECSIFSGYGRPNELDYERAIGAVVRYAGGTCARKFIGRGYLVLSVAGDIAAVWTELARAMGRTDTALPASFAPTTKAIDPGPAEGSPRMARAEFSRHMGRVTAAQVSPRLGSEYYEFNSTEKKR